MNKNILLLILCCASFVVTAQNKEFSSTKKLQTAEYLIQKLYVDSIDDDSLVESAIRGMLSDLDPHSVYSTPQEVKLFKESMSGEFVGIGIQYQILNDTVYVIKVIDDGPAHKAGILAGDRIVEVDGKVLGYKSSVKDILKLFRGVKGSKLSVKILRGNSETIQPHILVVKRNAVSIKTLMACYMLTNSVGYININQFGRHTYDEFFRALKYLEGQQMASLILDLRGNSGGLLDVTIDIANEFLGAKERIVYAKGKNVDLGSFYARGNGRFKKGKLVVLQDESSASASEILAGAIQDWDRGLIIGRRSFGKGLVQRPIDLNDGSMIRLTIARYYTPSGRYIQKPYEKGSDGQLNYRRELLSRLDRGEFVHADSIQQVDSLQFYTLKQKRLVYGGGGIMPDVFIPLNSIYLDKDFQKVLKSKAYQEAYLRYISENRYSLLNTYTEEQFISSYVIPSWLTKKIVGNLSREDVIQEVNRSLKALIGRTLYKDQTYYKVINQNDQAVKKALEMLEYSKYSQILN